MNDGSAGRPASRGGKVENKRKNHPSFQRTSAIGGLEAGRIQPAAANLRQLHARRRDESGGRIKIFVGLQ